MRSKCTIRTYLGDAEMAQWAAQLDDVTSILRMHMMEKDIQLHQIICDFHMGVKALPPPTTPMIVRTEKPPVILILWVRIGLMFL